jgi:hypothetical protein
MKSKFILNFLRKNLFIYFLIQRNFIILYLDYFQKLNLK